MAAVIDEIGHDQRAWGEPNELRTSDGSVQRRRAAAAGKRVLEGDDPVMVERQGPEVAPRVPVACRVCHDVEHDGAL